MKKLLLLAMALGLLMSGCATMIWTKDNFSEEEFKRDNYLCVQESRTQWSGGGSGLIGLAMIAGSAASAQAQTTKLYKMCMESKGWHLVDSQITPTPSFKESGYTHTGLYSLAPDLPANCHWEAVITKERDEKGRLTGKNLSPNEWVWKAYCK